MIINNRHQEMKPPSKSWVQSKPITSISIYKDWLYSASLVVEGSKIKVVTINLIFLMIHIQLLSCYHTLIGQEMQEWRRGSRPQISIAPEKGGSVVAIEVVEDFIYLNCSTSMSSLQVIIKACS